MAKRNNRVRSSVVGDPEEIDRMMSEEFNPTHTLTDPTGEYVGEMKENPDGSKEFVGKHVRELLNQFGSYYATSEKSFYDCIDPFLEQFNPVKIENEELQPEQPKVKTTAAFDNSRLEFLRMQIGPVQNFYQTLGNILYSLSMRLDVVEGRLYTAELKNKMYDEYAILIATEGRIVSMDEFKIHWDKLQKEKGNETRTDAK